MKKVTKAVIPAAGLGTRLLPATKAVPKELLPIINIPTIQYIVQEAIDSGIKEVLLVVSKGKEALIKHFTRDLKLEKELLNKKKEALYKLVNKAGTMCKIHVVYQDEQLGLGHAIYQAKMFAKGQPIAVLLGDDVVVTQGKTALKQCIDAYEKTGHTIVGVQPVRTKDISKYGIVAPVKANTKSKVFEINNMIEKPAIDEAPSNLGILGRYVLTPDIFDCIEKTAKDKSGEIQITNAMKIMLTTSKIYACIFDGIRYDLGNKFGMVKATVDFALNDPEIADDVKEFIKGKK